jgi:hypothetical protein
MFMVYDADMILYSNRLGAQLISVMDSTRMSVARFGGNYQAGQNLSNVFCG